MVPKTFQINLLWEVVEIRRERERVIAKFVYHEDAVDFHRRKIKAFRHLDFDVRQATKEKPWKK